MRRIDIMLGIAFVALVLGLVFLPDLIERWREPEPAAQSVPVEPEPVAEPAQAALDPGALRERVSGILLLHEACASRFPDFAAESAQTLEAWKQHHAATLAAGADLDFHIVFGEGAGDTAKSAEEELALCEGNLEAMREDLGTGSTE